jgi:two-component system C4-dicarboxylate transport sensor histidine kinase DctB
MTQLILLFMLVALAVVYMVAARLAEERLAQELTQHLSRLVNALDSTLSRHAYLPVLLAQQRELVTALTGSRRDPEALNRYLEKANAIAGTSDIYLMDRGGTTIAASNWNAERGFVGQNFAFRPYFQEAVEGRLGRYYALGTTSGERGYYFAYPLLDGDRVRGVLAVKIDIEAFEKRWSQEAFDFMVTDADGIVFLASQPQWRYRTISDMTTDRLVDILESRRYADSAIEPLDYRRLAAVDDGSLRVETDGTTYLTRRLPMQQAGWDVTVLARAGRIGQTAMLSLLVGAIIFSLLALLVYTLWQRQCEKRDLDRHLREELETKVAERTGELRQAQENLIQAAKMAALGQLSAGINHELNNPLTAIRAYADNARAFLEKGERGIVQENLEEIGRLTQRMAQITRQLRIFSRKSSGEPGRVDVETAIDGALAIIQPQLRERNIMIEREVSDRQLAVIGDLVWTEQILVNLLSNAMEAVQQQTHARIGIRVVACDDSVCIAVSDNGPGIGDEVLEELFEPFFTTKSGGKGLGLGLSISYQLARNMHGTLEAGNNEGPGATFRLRLPAATETGTKNR